MIAHACAYAHTIIAALPRSVVIVIVVPVDLVFPGILELAHLVLGGLFRARLAAGAAAGLLRSRSRVFRGAFWHVLVLLAAIKTVLASVGDAAEGPSGPDPSDLQNQILLQIAEMPLGYGSHVKIKALYVCCPLDI